MRKAITVILLALLAISTMSVAAKADYMPGEVIAKFIPNIGFRTQAFVRDSLGLRQMRAVFNSDYVVFAVPAGSTPEATIARLHSNPFILFAERNPVAHLTAVPNDPFFKNQWSLQTPGPGGFGINVSDAWSISTGNGVTVAVVDTGCAYEDYGPYYANPDLDPLRIRPGWNFVQTGFHPDDDSNFGHGTFMCSLIGATTNNDFSAAGIAPGCTLMPIKSFDSTGAGTADRIASGINYASRFGAKVILMGGATVEPSQCLQDIINQAVARGALVVAGSGNDGADLGASPGVQQVYSGVMYVGATAKDGSLAPYSNHGPFLSVVAPGGANDSEGPLASTYSPYDATVPPFGFRSDGTSVQPLHGTSVAAAHAAGVAALVMGALPGISAAATRAQIEQTARPLGDPRLYGAGLVDASAAVGVLTAATTGGPSAGGTPAGAGGGDTVPAETIDAAVTGLTVPAGPVVMGTATQIGVGVQNNGSSMKTVAVTLRDQATGLIIGSQNVGLTPGQATTVTFDWTAVAPAATHTLRATVSVAGDDNPANDSLTADVVVSPAELQLRITPSKSSYRGGEWIFVSFNATDGGQPAPGTQVDYKIYGATGYVVDQGTVSASDSGQLEIVMSRYYAFGGRGTYLVSATATRNGETITSQQTFQVTSARGF
jgi:subtilase family protein/fervidolysin-like protein